MVNLNNEVEVGELWELWKLGLVEIQAVVEILIERELAGPTGTEWSATGTKLKRIDVEQWRDPFESGLGVEDIQIRVEVETGLRLGTGPIFQKGTVLPAKDPVLLEFGIRQMIRSMIPEIERARDWESLKQSV